MHKLVESSQVYDGALAPIPLGDEEILGTEPPMTFCLWRLFDGTLVQENLKLCQQEMRWWH